MKSNYKNTISTYEAGNKEKAFAMFKDDPTAKKGVSFDKFCKGMENILSRRKNK